MPAGSHSASVNYVQPCYTLSRTHTGSGSDPSPSPIKSTGCALNYQYHAGEAINVTASPSSGYTVGSWNGTNNNSSTSTSNTVTMPSGNHTVTVNYTCTPYYLDINVAGDGSVNTSVSPNCGTGYLYNTAVKLTANPDNEFVYFDRWKDDLSGSTNPIWITMSKNWLITADFDYYYPTSVTNLNYTINGMNGPVLLDITFTWTDAQHEEYYELYMNEHIYDKTVNRSAGTTSFRIDNFYRCDYYPGWFRVKSINPYGDAQNTVTIDILNSGYYCGP